MAKTTYPQSQLPIRRTVELLPSVFRTGANSKFMSAVVDPLVQPGVLQKTVGYIGRRYGKTFQGKDVYLDSDNTLRSRYQLEPGVTYKINNKITNFYDYIDFKNQLKFFGNDDDRDDAITSQQHYSWNPPIDWDKYVNFREYYWEPDGPPPVVVLGQAAKITSSYKVRLGLGSTFIFTPDGATNNPQLFLFRGQTYKFNVNAPNNGLVIRTNYDTGSLRYNPNLGYEIGAVVLFDEKLWRATSQILPGDGSTIDIDTADWQLIGVADFTTVLDFNEGVTNNGIENGTITFKVPFDAPDVLFYQSKTDPDRFGQFVIGNIDENTKLDIDKDIIGKSAYSSSNDVVFTNGLIIEFRGMVTPSQYANSNWLVEGVGTAITLTRFSDLIVPVLTKDVPEVLFDNEGFDTQPFDDATAYPSQLDYITITRNSLDSNPWSRYNRWFHRSVLDYAHGLRGVNYSAPEDARAKRPIIEFNPNIQLFNHGAVAKKVVDYIDTFTTDIFSKIEGSTGYNIDGEFLFEGARILVVADTDSLANNRIYKVHFIKFNNNVQINLKLETDGESIIDECVLVRRGINNAGIMYHFDGSTWLSSQPKTKVNQPPLFDAYDEAGISFSDPEVYPVSSFLGTTLFEYNQGTSGVNDSQLGFPLTYLNIDNLGDIKFNWTWDSDIFYHTNPVNNILVTTYIATGFYKENTEYKNGWVTTNLDYIQPLLDSVVISQPTNVVTLTTLDWELVTDTSKLIINFYCNGTQIKDNLYTRDRGTFTFTTPFAEKDIVSVKIITDVDHVTGYYEIPSGLEKNPLNDKLTSFTFGQAIDHVVSALEFDNRFEGTIPGKSNLRDLVDYQNNAKRFLKHSGSTPLAMALLCDKENNIIKSLQYAKHQYTEFKNNFLTRSTELDYISSTPDFVDAVIQSLTSTKTVASPFADSDMIGSGAYSTVTYDVEDTGIKIFALNKKFSLDELSRNAVYVYINGQQLIVNKQYDFNATFGFVTLKVDLFEGDYIEIREYVSTAHCFIPSTPTKLGLYKKYTPMIFVDDTYREPKTVIQGHDGSITIAFGDYRDQLLLELEYRIYNNIKQQYDELVFNIDDILGGYYGNALYNKSHLDPIVEQEFLQWIRNTNIDYTNNNYFIDTEPFTYTYSNMTDPASTVNLPGYWRGVYKWAFDTDRPHRCPWEMLGFSEKPDWWDTEYGEAPYTSGNLLLWEDLRDGIIRHGARAGTYDRYKRPGLMDYIPVDIEGHLVNPLDSGFAGNFILINNRGPFKLGDIGPVEYAWRSSSEYPFAVAIALCLLKPFEFITDSFDRSRIKINLLGQTVSKNTGTFLRLADLLIPYPSVDLSSGLVCYLVNYTQSKGKSLDSLETKIQSIDVNLATRLSGFVDKAQQKYLLDSKSPKSASSSIYVPAENYDIVFNVSAPISTLSYSGVIVEKNDTGWHITGYDDIHPFFYYYEAQVSQGDPLLSIGGLSENFVDWQPGREFTNGIIVKNNNDFYRSLSTHTDSDDRALLDKTVWKKLAKLPLVGSVDAFKRRKFNTFEVSKIGYGTSFTTIQEVVDFLLGYEAYLQGQGFVFTNYDPINQVSQDWTTSSKEFMFWTRHNWAVGSLITLSPAATKINIVRTVGVADNLLDGFYDYQVLKSDGKPLLPQFINVDRSFQEVTVETTNTTDGIYFLRLYYVLKEHVAIFDDRTVFNDVIYDKSTGYRQQRIKSQGFRTTDWYGDYTSPGFLFDNVDIAFWEPFTDYKLGDIVAYKSYYWTSLSNQEGQETFDYTYWSKLDSVPEKQLISNFDYKINQFDDYFNVASEGIGNTQRELARHTIGYQERTYLQELAEDPVTQFQLYQGFIREKGTQNAISKVFDKLSRYNGNSIELREEWAFQVGRLGGTDQLREIEIELQKNNVKIDPQPIIATISATASTTSDKYYRVAKADFTISPLPYVTDIHPMTSEEIPSQVAGYVKTDQIDFAVSTVDDVVKLDIASVLENNHIWITFNIPSWTIWRLNQSPVYVITDVSKTSTTVTVTLNRIHDLTVDTVVGIRDVVNLTGFYKITAVTDTTFSVTVAASAQTPVLDQSTISSLHLFTVVRFTDYGTLDPEVIALLPAGSKLWVDDSGTGEWEVLKKNKQYKSSSIVDYGLTSPIRAGTKVLYNDALKQTIVGIPGSGYVVAYIEIATSTPGETALSTKQIIAPPSEFLNASIGSFGSAIAISPDNKWMVVGAPLASNINSNYMGLFNKMATYFPGEVVLYNGVLWKAKTDINTDGSTNAAYDSDNWTLAEINEASENYRGPGYYQQGMISIYERVNDQWEIAGTYASPRPAIGEQFGSNIAIGVNGSTYFLSVSAVGSLDGTGRVYLYKGIETTVVSPGGYTSTMTTWKHHDTQLSLPQQLALLDDGSTLVPSPVAGQLVEMLKENDQFGYSVSMNQAGSILAVGAPNSDGQFFVNYKGIWRPTVTYVGGDVVQRDSLYYSLGITVISNTNDDPSNSAVWASVGDSTLRHSGKVFIYHRNISDNFELVQTIDAATLSSISDISDSTETIDSGDKFGFAIALDYSGRTMVVTSPMADLNLEYRGSAYVLQTESVTSPGYRLKQKLKNFESYYDEYFGQSVAITANSETIVVGAKNSPGNTTGDAGAVYVFERKTVPLKDRYNLTIGGSDYYFLAEKLTAILSPFESFGASVDCQGSTIVVGSPDYFSTLAANTGTVRLFRKDPTVNSWEKITYQLPVVDIEKIRSIALYDNVRDLKIQDLDIVDPAKLKILNEAEQEIEFKTPFDPAIYSVGTEAQTVIPTQEWDKPFVGKIWWNISTAKWLYYEQGDISYKIGNWGVLAPGASIDVYEWIESPLQPSEWAAIADTNDGVANGISGQPLYPNNDVYSVKVLYNPTTGLATNTVYYYWVKNKTITPTGITGRKLPASTIASYISNPAAAGTAFVSIIGSDTMLVYNLRSVMASDTALLNIQYHKDSKSLNAIHNEFQLIVEGDPEGVPAKALEEKWIDSLVGYDAVGNRVPDPGLPAKQRYGVSFRPRQGMFVDRIAALKIVIQNINHFLQLVPYVDVADFTYLNLVDPIPNNLYNLYDVSIDTDSELFTVGTVRVKPATVSINLVDGEVDTIDIITQGFGYKVAPPIVIDGDGVGATAECTIDNQGKVVTVTVLTRGKKYSVANGIIRNFSVLVVSDSTANGDWGIYSWDTVKQTFYRSKSQAYDTTKYWSRVDWWASKFDQGDLVPIPYYGETSRIVKEIQDISLEPTIYTQVGDLIRIKEYASGGWAVFVKINEGGSFSENYQLVGRQEGTLQLSQEFYRTSAAGTGYDNNRAYDTNLYDVENAKELRNILKAVKENAYNLGFGELWSNLFFISIRHVLTEQKYVDWFFKTSFLKAIHNVGSFEERLNYKNDNLASFQEYVDEVKPYRTTIREYISRYDTVEPFGGAVSDFDIPPAYSPTEGRINALPLTDERLNSYPWKWWTDNHKFSIVNIQISYSGKEYTLPPTVLITGDGTGATAKAYISNGEVSGIQVLTSGENYTTAKITLVGGNGNSLETAKAVAILGDSKSRTFGITMKFDRISKEGIYREFSKEQIFTAPGDSAVFELSYAPTRDKNKIKLFKNGQVVYKDEYAVSLYKSSTDSYSLLKGKIVFSEVPAANDIIRVVYEKNDELLDSVNRIQKYYLTNSDNAVSGLPGKELSQLMTGFDFGGVQVQGTTFEVTGGWDALPWFTDGWDSVESSSDIYYVCDGSTVQYVFDAAPAAGDIINIYIKRKGTTDAVRIDDPLFTSMWDSSMATNPNAEMPTFVGDGSTIVIELGQYISTEADDILIFRTLDSDGSVSINDPNILDTKLTGGTLASMAGAYSTASGIAAEDIVIEGGEFVSPDQVPATEENVPGQVLDSVSIKVFQSSIDGVAPVNSRTLISDGATNTYDIGIQVLEFTSVLVYKNKTRMLLGTDYNLFLKTQKLIFNTTPLAGDVIEIIAIGIGGHSLLDYQEFVADGDTSLFLTNANFLDTSSVFVTVNGIYQSVGFVDSTGVVDATGKTLVQFGNKPTANDLIFILALGNDAGAILDGKGVVRINQQIFIYDGSTKSYSLDNSIVHNPLSTTPVEFSDSNFNNDVNASAESSMLVELDGRALDGPDTTYFVYDGIQNQFVLGVDPVVPSGSILTSNIKCYINNRLASFIQDYVFDGSFKTITIAETSLTKNDVIKIVTDFNSEYRIIDNSIVLDEALAVPPTATIKVTWFGEYPSMKFVSDEFTGGKIKYQLAHTPLSGSYVWVYKNGSRLTLDQDYTVDVHRAELYLTAKSTTADQIKVLLFGSEIFKLPTAWEISKDMLNIYHFNRFSQSIDVVLASDLHYYDTEISVTDASQLSTPILIRNIPGVVLINGEKIEYMQKIGNTLRQLRRGTVGTSIKPTHTAGSYVVDVGTQETIPYNEEQERIDFVSDGSADDSTIGSYKTIGALEFVPMQGTRSTAWYRGTIPTTFGPCDQIEVFVGGRRLRKDPVKVYDETLGVSSPAADITLEAEFSVDGITPYIRLTTTPPAGARITIIKRTGKTWYDRGESTATSGVTFLENTSSIATFIAQRTTKLPE